MDFFGKIKVIKDEQRVSENFRKREIVISTEEQYPQHVLFQFTNDKCDRLNGFKVGEEVKISFNINGREWQNKEGETVYFNTLTGWKIEKLGDASPAPFMPFEPIHEAELLDEEEKDDLPF